MDREAYLYDAGNDEWFVYATGVELGYCINSDADMPDGPTFGDHARAMLAGKELPLPQWGEDVVRFGSLLAIYHEGSDTVEIIEEPHVCVERFDRYAMPRARAPIH